MQGLFLQPDSGSLFAQLSGAAIQFKCSKADYGMRGSRIFQGRHPQNGGESLASIAYTYRSEISFGSGDTQEHHRRDAGDLLADRAFAITLRNVGWSPVGNFHSSCCRAIGTAAGTLRGRSSTLNPAQRHQRPSGDRHRREPLGIEKLTTLGRALPCFAWRWVRNPGNWSTAATESAV